MRQERHKAELVDAEKFRQQKFVLLMLYKTLEGKRRHLQLRYLTGDALSVKAPFFIIPVSVLNWPPKDPKTPGTVNRRPEARDTTVVA